LNKDNLTVVLVESQGDRNIGSVCRVMLNFGFTDLRLVNPQIDHLSFGARQMAVKASGLLESAQVFDSLAAALADCNMSFGTTRRFGRYREGLVHPDEAARQLLPVTEEGRVALVFGREDKGLLTAELDLCQQFITIPTNPELPSINLAQAVGLCVYEVNRISGELAGCEHGRKKLATNDQLEPMFQHMRESLINIGYLNPQNPDHILRSFRRILGRSGLNDREVRILRGLFNQIDIYTGAKERRHERED
jgi:tRNA/rRNA methyltransferase